MAEYEARDAAGRPIIVEGTPVGTPAGGHPVMVDGRPAAAAGYANGTDRTVVRERRSGGGGWLIALLIIVALVVAAFAFKLINIDQLSSGSAPKVAVTGGSLPTFKVDTAKLAIGSKTDTVKVPTVDVGSKDTAVSVPTLHVEKADGSDAPKQ